MENQVPLIDAGSTLSGSVREPDSASPPSDNVAGGVILFTDADASDLHSFAITGVTSSGVTAGLADDQALLALLTTGTLAEPADGQPGSVSWHFAAADPLFDYLAAGEIVTLTYAALIDDGQGGRLLRDITLTITGSNDAPTIDASSSVSGSVHELDAASVAGDNVAEGTILFADADASDVHSFAITAVSAAGATSGLPDDQALLALLITGTLVEPTAGQPGSVSWHFDAADPLFDHLAAGEVLTLTYVGLLGDGHGGTVSRDITLTITGTNDAPIIEAASTVSGTVNELDGTAPGGNLANGAILFTDADTADLHSVTITSVASTGATSGLPNDQALLGLLTIDTLVEPAVGGPGSLSWHFTAADPIFDYLAAGEAVTLTYAALLDDGQGGAIPQDITLTITGTNDAPVVDGASLVAGSVNEPDGSASGGNVADGVILFTDPDASDVHSIAITGVASSGVTSGLPDDQALLGLLTTGALVEAGGGQPGSVSWQFAAVDPLFDYLAEGETVTLTYAAVLDDGQGGSIQQDIRLTITGTNDEPIIDGASTVAGSVDEPDVNAPGGNVADGAILFTDPDAGDLHSIAITGVTSSGATSGLPDDQALLSLLTTGSMVEPGAGQPGSVSWHFDGAGPMFDYLAAGEIVTLTYAARIDDGQGGTASQSITLTITGTNDEPIVDGASTVAGSVDEPDVNAPGVADGAILFTDADASDLHSIAITDVTSSGVTSGLPDDQALLGLLTTGTLVDAVAGQPGSVSWQFAATDPLFDYLAAGESVTLTYAASIADGQGGEARQDVTIAILGTNDAPVFDAGTVDSGSVRELGTGSAAGDNVAGGAILFSDPDASDVHSFSITGVTSSGVTSGLPDDQALLGLMTSGTPIEPIAGQPGSVSWNFTAAESLFDYLADGEVVTLTFAALLGDGQGGAISRDITLTITGSNDAPIIDAASTVAGAVHQLDGASAPTANQADGIVLFGDADASDTHGVTITGVSASGVTTGLPDAQALLGLLTAGALVEPTAGQPGSVSWHFDGDSHLFDYLATGETATLTYRLSVSDGHGGVAERDVVIHAGDTATPYTYDYSFANGPTPWTSWMNPVLVQNDTGQYASYTSFNLPGTLDPNHLDGIGPLWLIAHLGAAVTGAAGAMDMRGAEISITIRGADFNPNGAALYFWICSYLPNGDLQAGYYEGLQVTNYAFTAHNLAGDITDDWTTITVKLDANPTDWTYAGNNVSGQGDWGDRYAPMGLNDALSNVNATLHVVLVGQDINHTPSGQIEIENITVRTAHAALPNANQATATILHGLENEPVSGSVDPTGSIALAGGTFQLVTDSGKHGTVVLDPGTGQFVFTPDENYFGFTDTSTDAYFDYVISDGLSVTTPHRIHFFIAPVAPTPEAYGGSEDIEIAADAPFDFYLFKGSDSNGSALGFVLDPDSVTGGTIVLDPVTGRYSFTPNAGFSGPAGFSYAVSNGTNVSASKSVTFNVVPADQPLHIPSYAEAFNNFQQSGDNFALARDLSRLADAGNANAAYNLGLILLSGTRGIRADKAEAAHYLGLAVGTEADASIQLARLYIAGDGVGRDYTMAHTLLQGVAALPVAQYLLGLMSGLGLGAAADGAAAATYFLHAASQGYVDAMYTLGRRYLAGDGVEADPKAAYFWLETALKYGGGGPQLIQFTQLLQFDANLAARQMDQHALDNVQAAVALWHPGLPTPYETQADYHIRYDIAGTFYGQNYAAYVDTYDFSGVRTMRSYVDSLGHDVVSETFTFDGGYIIARGGVPAESYTVQLDGSYEITYFIVGTFAGQAYASYANHYSTVGLRDSQTFFGTDGEAVAAQLFAPGGGVSLIINGALREQKINEPDGGYDIHYFISGTFAGQAYVSYANHYAAGDFRDAQTFYGADGSAVAGQGFTPDGGVSLTVNGALREQKIIEPGGGYDIHYYIAGSFAGQSYVSYANHYGAGDFRDSQTFYGLNGHAVAAQGFTADGGVSLSIDGALREQKITATDGSYEVHYFIAGTFAGKAYVSYANHYAADNFRDAQTFYDADGDAVAAQGFTPDGGVSLSVDGQLREQKTNEPDGGYAVHYFIAGTFAGQAYVSYANHYAADNFRDAQTFYDAAGHAVAAQDFTHDGGVSLTVDGALREQKINEPDGGYEVHYFITGTFAGQAYVSYTNHYSADNFRDAQTFYSSSGDAVAAQLFSPDGGVSLFVDGQIREQKINEPDGGYEIHYFITGTFAGQAYVSYANHYAAGDFRDAQTFYDTGGDPVAAQLFTPEGGVSLIVDGVLLSSKQVLPDGETQFYYHFSNLPYSAEDDIYSATGARIEQSLHYPDGSIKIALFSDDMQVDVGHSIQIGAAGTSFDIGAADSILLDFGDHANETVVISDADHDVGLRSFSPSDGDKLVLPGSVFADFDDLIAHSEQNGADVMIHLDGHLVQLFNFRLEGLTSATVSFG